MSDLRVVCFVFAGREPNMQLQIPLMQTILEQHPNVEYHIWNLARNHSDDAYLRKLECGDRVQVRNDYFGLKPRREGLTKVWQHYTDPQYADCLFTKLDDDITFLETDRFGEFVAAVDDNRGEVISANVINNAACAHAEPELWERYRPRSLLDAHRYQKFAELSHNWFFDNWRDVVATDAAMVPTEDWLSINTIGFDYPTLCEIVGKIGGSSPRMISGRPFPLGFLVGDEGAVNMLPRNIFRGFTVAHLAFGPQNVMSNVLAGWRRRYAKICDEYLSAERTG